MLEPMPKSATASFEQPDTAGGEYKFSDQIGHLLRRAYQRHIAIFQQTIVDSQLTSAQFVVLCAVHDQTACSMSDIVKKTAIDQATIRGIIERLKGRKLITVSHDADDRRKVRIGVTATGVALLKKTIPSAKVVTEETFGELNVAERVAIVYLLRKMAEFDDSESDASESTPA
jgi:DNA-binding MarR family transcriptional regulator